MTLYDVEESRRIVVPRTDYDSDYFLQRYVVDEDVTLIGLDCEWRTRWARYDVALIQIATEDFVFLFQTCRFDNENALPRQLSKILYNSSIVKVGVNIEEDVRRISRQFRLSVNSWLDLRCFGIEHFVLGECLLQQLQDHELLLAKGKLSTVEKKAKRTSFMPKLGLETLVAVCLDQTLPKAFDDQVLGKWEEDELPQNLKRYAAADAAASLDVFHELRHRIGRKSWYSVVERPYNHKNIRFHCLDKIAEIAPSRIQAILPAYYGRSYGKRSETGPSQGQTCDDKVLRRGIRELEEKAMEEEQGLSGWLKRFLGPFFSFIINLFNIVASLLFIVTFLSLAIYMISKIYNPKRPMIMNALFQYWK